MLRGSHTEMVFRALISFERWIVEVEEHFEGFFYIGKITSVKERLLCSEVITQIARLNVLLIITLNVRCLLWGKQS